MINVIIQNNEEIFSNLRLPWQFWPMKMQDIMDKSKFKFGSNNKDYNPTSQVNVWEKKNFSLLRYKLTTTFPGSDKPWILPMRLIQKKSFMSTSLRLLNNWRTTIIHRIRDRNTDGCDENTLERAGLSKAENGCQLKRKLSQWV